MKKSKFKYQRVSGSTTAEHCCVPQCHASAKYNTVLSFFTFPADEEVRRKWIVAICRDKVTAHTRVCSRHFKTEDLREPASETGRRLLKKGAVPVLFKWNNYSFPPTRPGVLEKRERPPPEDDREDTVVPDHVTFDVPVQHDSKPEGSRPFQSNRGRLCLQAIKGVAAQDSSSPVFVPSVFPWSQQSQKLNTNMGRNQRKRLIDDVGTPPHQPVALTTKQGSAGHLAKRAPEVKKEDVIEVIVGETGEGTPTTNVSESPETFNIEGRYAAGTWEQATVEAIMSLRSLGTTVTATQVAQTIIANLKDENDFVRAHNANLRSELNAKQWTHEQEIGDLQERLERLKQKCSCGAISEKTDTSSEAALSDVMVAEIKTEHISYVDGLEIART
ncbi:uncharacterized protein LOC125286240 isoform X1 [Alosa alosa]|uniref:uncharacterized protein LOC125286240 isoform X1 n=1 Tax=Alosa alosa TaxID=278164 RepID=UPI0020150AF8|nr:uncharacterized protein LOC125286240 isoform X1 [Alosa alosa]